MSLVQQRRYDFRWHRGHLAALVALSFLSAGMLGAGAFRERTRIGSRPPVNQQRVAAAQEKVNPNVATAGSLRRLPGIGPVKAQAILEYRAACPGRAFARAEDLDKVGGLGPGAVERLRPYLEFSSGS